MSSQENQIIALINDGQLRKALVAIEDSTLPKAEKFFYRGICFNHAGETIKAVAALKSCIALNPLCIDAYQNLGQIYINLSEWSNAIKCFNKSCHLDPENADKHYALGLSYLKNDQEDKAEDCFRETLRLQPKHVHALNKLGGMLGHRKSHFEEAISLLKKALSSHPHAREIHTNLANTYQKIGTLKYSIRNFDSQAKCSIQVKHTFLKKAAEHMEYILKKTPNHYALRNNYAGLLMDLFQPEKAIPHIQKSIALKNTFIPAHFNLARAYDLLGEDTNALNCYRKIIEADNSFESSDYHLQNYQQNADWHTGLILLRQGKFHEGWLAYERGLHNNQKQRRLPKINTPFWRGEPLTGKNFLLTVEQGVGDEIMFASHLQKILHEAKHIWLECDTRLIPLYTRSFPNVELIPVEDLNKHDHLEALNADLTAPIGSLAIHRMDNHLPAQPYLVPNKNHAQQWKERFQALGEGLKVGLSWKGGAQYLTRIQRSIPPYLLKDLLTTPDIYWINCQYGHHQDDRDQMHALSGTTVHDWPDSNPAHDLDNFCAKLSSLDLVISIDNSTVHFAGALGIETWVLLPYVAEWRWGKTGNTTHWYTSLELFRQPKPLDWSTPLNTIRSRLQKKTTAA